MTLVVGVDGGGTHTRAVVADATGQVLARAQCAGAVVHAAEPSGAANAVSAAVRAAAQEAGVALPVASLWAGLAGAGLEPARRSVERELESCGLADRVLVATDVEAAFHAAFGPGPGVLLIAGTGSIAWARNPAGEVVRVGGWGEWIGDEGSGFSIGLAALRAVARAEDRRGPATALRDLVLARLGVERPDALVGWVAEATKGDVAALVPVVSQAASEGDQVASDLLEEAVAELSLHLSAVLERAGAWPEPPGLVLWGGLLVEGGSLHARMVESASALNVRLASSEIDPALGAAKLALASLA